MFDELDEQASRSWNDYLDVLVRRRRWILGSLFLCWMTIWSVSWLLPASYQSEAMILVDQQKVPDNYVVPNVTMNLQSRLQGITQQVLSRGSLQKIIDRFQLYPAKQGMSSYVKPGDPVEQMKNDIKIDLVDSPGHPGDFTAFKIRYSASSPQLAQEVTSELTSLFVDENKRVEDSNNRDVTDFLESQLADARAKMAEQEAKVAAFKAKHAGDLPGQMESNVQILSGLQSQLQNTQQALDAAKQQKIYLQSLMQQYQTAQSSLGTGASSTLTTASLDKQIVDMRLRLEDLHAHYTDDYPDIVRLKAELAKTEKMKQDMEADMAAHPAAAASGATDLGAAEGVQHGAPTPMMQVQSQIKANEVEVANYQQHEKDLENQISSYQSRLNMTPETEQELTDISRGYEESKTNYNSLLQKQMQSQVATHLVQREEGDQFRVLDPPTTPTKPSAPNHLWISLGGLVAGIAVGVCMAAFLELTDIRVRQEKDIEGIVPASVLIAIPRLSTPNEEHSRSISHWLEIGAATAMALVIAVGNLYAIYKG